MSFATDPDENRTRGTHSLVGNLAALELIGHAPRRSKPVVINACRHAAVESNSPEVDEFGLPQVMCLSAMATRTASRRMGIDA